MVVAGLHGMPRGTRERTTSNESEQRGARGAEIGVMSCELLRD